MCKRDDIKCEICSSKLCVSWCCGYAMAHFSRATFLFFLFFLFGSFIRIRLPSDFASNNFSLAMERDKRRSRQLEKSSLPTFGKCGCFCFLFANAVARFPKWMVGTVWGKMSRYLNYRKSFIIAIITNANFRHKFLLLLLLFGCCSVALLQTVDYFFWPFFTILPMWIYLHGNFFFLNIIRELAVLLVCTWCALCCANVSNIFPILMWCDAMCFTCAYFPIFSPLCFFFGVWLFSGRHLFISWCRFIFSLQFFRNFTAKPFKIHLNERAVDASRYI